MSIFNIEIDTSAKTSKISIDGKEVPLKEFSASQYTWNKCDMDGGTGSEKRCTYLSITKDDGNGTKTSYGLSFDTDGSNSESYSVNNYDISKEVAKIHKNAIQASMIAKIVGLKKPIRVYDISSWTNFQESEPLKEPDFMK